MRCYLLLMLGILSLPLIEQNTRTANKQGWEISASFSPDLHKTVVAENLQIEYIPEKRRRL